jgi:uncharacterized protein YjcR
MGDADEPGNTRMRHKRISEPMLNSARCGAKTRSGGSCRSPAVKGKSRCRMHGGAKGSGAPKGNQNALKHGAFCKAALQERAEMSELIREVREVLRTLEPNG